jgi:hypothetical protein
MYSTRLHTLQTGGIQNIPDWCRYLYSSCGSAKHRSQQLKLWIPGSTAKFCGDCEKMCEDFTAPNFGENRPGCFTMTTPRLTLPSSPSCFWRNTKWLLSPTHRIPNLAPCDFLFPKMKLNLKGRRFDTIEEIQAESQTVLTVWQKRTSRKSSKNGGDGGTGVCMQEGPTSRVMAAVRPYGEFYEFYSVSPEYFGHTLYLFSITLSSRPSKQFPHILYAVRINISHMWQQ